MAYNPKLDHTGNAGNDDTEYSRAAKAKKESKEKHTVRKQSLQFTRVQWENPSAGSSSNQTTNQEGTSASHVTSDTSIDVQKAEQLQQYKLDDRMEGICQDFIEKYQKEIFDTLKAKTDKIYLFMWELLPKYKGDKKPAPGSHEMKQKTCMEQILRLGIELTKLELGSNTKEKVPSWKKEDRVKYVDMSKELLEIWWRLERNELPPIEKLRPWGFVEKLQYKLDDRMEGICQDFIEKYQKEIFDTLKAKTDKIYLFMWELLPKYKGDKKPAPGSHEMKQKTCMEQVLHLGIELTKLELGSNTKEKVPSWKKEDRVKYVDMSKELLEIMWRLEHDELPPIEKLRPWGFQE
jgi:hypothetical protein